ncbi:MAG TPA: hypothetical protein EYP14_02570 [Planctomycetaceae bacterium]|nr:hypothetical protein [Planctomycetaceae bacterium]
MPDPSVSEKALKPYVFVTLNGPDDGGDFGPHTPGTKTSGLQEALDYAHRHCRDVYIFGGRGGLHQGQSNNCNVYWLDETLRVPWSQDFRLDGGNYLLVYRKPTGYAVTIDSQMNCRYKFGLIVSQSRDAAVCICPRTAGPDDFVLITASIFDFSAVVSGHPEGTAILIDSRHGPIINSQFFFEEFNAQGVGMHVSDAGGDGHPVTTNRIEVMFGNQRHARDRCIGLRLGDPGSRHIVDNKIAMSFHAPQGAHFDTEKKRYVTAQPYEPHSALGADIFAQRNLMTFWFSGRRARGQDLVFEPDSRDNTVFAFDLPNGITNKARVPSNRVVPCGPVGFAVTTPPVPPSGRPVQNRNPYPVQVLVLAPGRRGPKD